MILITAICVGVCFGVAVYMLLGRELKGIAMGVFLMSHAANLSIIAMSGSPVIPDRPGMHEVHALEGDTPVKSPPILADHTVGSDPLEAMVDPLPQALILTAIVIGFAVMCFLLTLLVQTARKTETLNVGELAEATYPKHEVETTDEHR